MGTQVGAVYSAQMLLSDVEAQLHALEESIGLGDFASDEQIDLAWIEHDQLCHAIKIICNTIELRRQSASF